MNAKYAMRRVQLKWTEAHTQWCEETTEARAVAAASPEQFVGVSESRMDILKLFTGEF
jgi:hypothetical protein